MEKINELLTMLCGRGGFDDWWCNIDEDTQNEIREEMGKIIYYPKD